MSFNKPLEVGWTECRNEQKLLESRYEGSKEPDSLGSLFQKQVAPALSAVRQALAVR